MSEIRVGIIGCGALGRIHAHRLSAMPGVRVAALADPDPARLEALRKDLAPPPALCAEDYRRILDGGLDAVCIATPDSLHAPQTLDALAANLHVLCEKPLTLDPIELEAVIASAREVDRRVSLTYPRRYDAGIRAMRNQIRSGRWGEVASVVAFDCEDWVTPNRGTWRHDPEMCPGGFLYDANGHQLDTIFWATGLSAQSVRAETDHRGCAVPIASWGTARLEGGAPLAFGFVGDARKWREQVNIHCAAMDFVLESGRALWVRDGELVPIPPEGEEETADSAFIRLLRSEGPNWAPPEEMWPVLRFTRAALLSASQEGREVEIR